MARPLTLQDAQPAAQALAASFQDDPLFRWLLPSPRRRRAWLQVIAAGALHDCLPDGCAFAPDAGPAAGCIAMIPPGCYPPPARRAWRFLLAPRLRPPLPWPTARLAARGLAALRALERLHPRGPHYYIQIVGIAPTHARRGHGRELLGRALALADRDACPAYLETANADNLGFYGRFGFRVTAQLPTRGGGPPLWTMQREPS